MSFNTIFDKLSALITGENGANVLKTLVSSSDITLENFNTTLIELFLLVRGDTTIKNKIDAIFSMIKQQKDLTLKKLFYINFVKTALFIRNPRNGKGEKALFWDIIKFTLDHNIEIAKLLISFIPEFGCWQDINHLYNINIDIRKYLVEIMGNQILKDIELCEKQEYNKLSLVGKWAPRENSKFKQFATELAYYITQNNKGIKYYKMKLYRQHLSKLNTALNTVEQFMCQKHWEDIDFNKVPSVSMTQYTNAFQDIKVSKFSKSMRRNIKTTQERRHNDKRDPDYYDRRACREHLLSFLQENKKVKSSVTNLSTIINNYLSSNNEDVVYESQWRSRVDEVKELVKQLPSNPGIFPMVDLSSSMKGNPMVNAITLGLFTSMILDTEKEENEFCNRFMTFNTTPDLVRLPRDGSLYSKISVMKDWTTFGRWGGSTNIQLAIRTLLDIGKKYNLPNDKMPKILAIFSDMQFDEGDSEWNETSYDMIKRDFDNANYTVPHIIFWNLKSNTKSYEVLADTPNTTMLSGFSTRMLDLFLTGDSDTLKIQDNKKSTMDVFMKALNHKMFDKFIDDIDKRVSVLC